MSEGVLVNCNPADLVKFWGIPRLVETRQMTVRVPNETFYRIQALEKLFPHRSRTEIVADLLAAALQQVETGLPVHSAPAVQPEFEGHEDEFGPLVDYRRWLHHFRMADTKEESA
jgi:hypothetical protein